VRAYLTASAYHFVPPSLFAYVDRMNAASNVVVRPIGGSAGRGGAVGGAGSASKFRRTDPSSAASGVALLGGNGSAAGGLMRMGDE
jgi:hypothetical protein